MKKTLAERMNQETSVNGISEKLFLETINKLQKTFTNQVEELKALIATIGNESKSREERINTLLTANERILIDTNRRFLQPTIGESKPNKETSVSDKGNDSKSNNIGNGNDSKVQLDNGFTFDFNKFRSVYPYRIHETFEPAMKAFQESLTCRINGFEAFQTVYETFVKKHKDYDIRKIVPGVMKVSFWSSIKQALTFNKPIESKPIKQALQVEETKGIEKNDLVTLTGILDSIGIEKETLINTINKVKPLLTKEDFDKQGFINEDLFQEVSSMLGFTIDNRAMVSKVKLHISRLLA